MTASFSGVSPWAGGTGMLGGYQGLCGQKELTLEQQLAVDKGDQGVCFCPQFTLGAMEVCQGAGQLKQLCLRFVFLFE